LSRRRTGHSSRRTRVAALREQLADHIGALRMANSSLMVCVQALQQQNAEMDADIARVLQRQVSDPLDAATEGIEALGIVQE
jgi:triosephosphate isomerase